MIIQTKIIKKVITNNNSDGILLYSQINRKWFLNFDTSFGFLFINKNMEAYFITDSRYFLAAKKNIKNATVVSISITKNQDLSSIIETVKTKLKIKTLLLEEEYINIQILKFIQKFWTADNLNFFASKVIREIKSDDEIKLLQASANIIVKVMKWLWTVIKPGMSEIQVAKMISIKILELGADGNSFDPIVAAGSNGANPHHHPSNYKIKNGDMVTVDIGCMYLGYASDMTRTFVVGKKCNTPEMLEIYQIVYDSQLLGLINANTQISGANLDNVCRQVIDKTIYKSLFAHGTGHGVGLEVHELPNVNTSNKELFACNNVITIEPGIYKNGIGGVRIEDTIVIKNQKPIILTRKCQKKLLYLNN